MKGKSIVPSELLVSYLEMISEFTDVWTQTAQLLQNDPSQELGVKSPNASRYREQLALEIDLAQKVQDFHDVLLQRHLEGDADVLLAHCFILKAVAKELRRLNIQHIDELGKVVDMDLSSADRD